MLITVLLVIQIVAFPCTLLYGRLAARFETRTLLFAGIAVYCLITFLAFLLPFLEGHLVRHTLFWAIALLVASSMGGIQALSRSYFSKLIPPENSAEFFGFYNVSGKFAAIAGPALLGIVGGCATGGDGLDTRSVEAVLEDELYPDASFEVTDTGVRVETPLSLRSVLDRVPTGLLVYADADDPLRKAWDEFVLPQVDAYDRDHYETVWNAVVRRGPSTKPFQEQ